MAAGVIIYVDGSNLLREVAKVLGCPRARSDKPSDFHLKVGCALAIAAHPYAGPPLRRYWFGSYQGDDIERMRIRKILCKEGFDPHLFKQKDGREKGVDISLTKEMLIHAFHHNCAESILVAGDEDYVPLVQEVKRYGQRVHLAFLQPSTSEELKLNCDAFHELNPNAEHLGFVHLGPLVAAFKASQPVTLPSPTQTI